MKLYIVSYGESGIETGEGAYCLVAENGKCWYSHHCSSKGFAKGDLINNRPERKKELKKEYGDYEVLFLGEDNMTMEELLKRNEKYNKENTNGNN